MLSQKQTSACGSEPHSSSAVWQYMLKIDASFGERKRWAHHWTQHRRVEASLHVAAQAKGLNWFRLPFSHTAFILLKNSLQAAQCASECSHYPPPQPLAKLSPNALLPIIQQASNINKCIRAVAGGCSQFCVSRCINCYPQNVASQCAKIRFILSSG